MPKKGNQVTSDRGGEVKSKAIVTVMSRCTSCDAPCDSRYLCSSCSHPVHRCTPEIDMDTLHRSTIFGGYIEGSPLRRLCAACQAGRLGEVESVRLRAVAQVAEAVYTHQECQLMSLRAEAEDARTEAETCRAEAVSLRAEAVTLRAEAEALRLRGDAEEVRVDVGNSNA
jgi:hypothetical protein